MSEIKATKITINLKVCPHCQSQFANADETVCPHDSSLLCPISSDPLIGSFIGNYVVLAEVGTGGSGKVYKAEHRSLRRVVALKVLDGQLLSDPESVKRFEESARAIRDLTHPSITSLFDYGLLPDARPYMVMEFIAGQTLTRRISENVFTNEETIALFGQICDAMQTAHAAGVLHRDLKPGNIMIDTNGTAKIVDFGLAKFMNDDRTNITATGAVLGTPAYMSPEQCLGHASDVRSDIYSLGCVLYEAVTGQQIFTFGNSFDAMRKHVRLEPIKPSLHAVGLSPQLESVILKCLEKDPDQRFDSMQQVKECLNGAPIPLGGKANRTKESESDKGSAALAAKQETPYKLLMIVGAPLCVLLLIFSCYVMSSAPAHRRTSSSAPTEGLSSRQRTIAYHAATYDPPSLVLSGLSPEENESGLSKRWKAVPNEEFDKTSNATDRSKYENLSKRMQFPGLWFESYPVLAGKFNPFDPDGHKLQPIRCPDIHSGVFNPTTAEWYVTTDDALIRIDRSGRGTNLPLPAELQGYMLKGARAIAFDSKRNRLAIALSTFGKDIYFYDLTTKQWSSRELSQHVFAVHYSPSKDRFYCFSASGNRESKNSLSEMTPDGAIVKSTLLPGRIFSLQARYNYDAQMFEDENHLVLLVTPFNNKTREVYLLDKATQKIVFSKLLVSTKHQDDAASASRDHSKP